MTQVCEPHESFTTLLLSLLTLQTFLPDISVAPIFAPRKSKIKRLM